ncbi:MAG: asparaginase [Dehalococcoidia bacterium]
MTTQAKPLVKVVSAGGTITGIGRGRLDLTNYTDTGDRLQVEELLARVPEVQEVARIQGVQSTMFRITISTQDWLELHGLLTRILQEPEVAGVVVTHGTSLMEETAYFLHLTLKSEKPVVLVGAQRPSTAISGDGDLNLLSAVRVIASSQAHGMGVMVCMNEEINSAREVTKSSAYRVHTFQSRDLGFLGYADSDGRVVFYRRPTRRHTSQSELDVTGVTDLPRVDIVYVHAGCDGLPVEALVERGAKGIVTAGAGAGNTSEPMTEALARARQQGVAVVESTRVGSGRVVVTEARKRHGFVAADNLSPQKARILLMLALLETNDPAELQRLYDEY